MLCHIANRISTDSHVVLGLRLFDMARYKLSQFAHEDANIGRRRFPLVRFRRFFCTPSTLLGLINRLNPYTVQESYLVRGSYGGNKCKSRSRKLINKTCAYYVGLTLDTPFTVSTPYYRFRTVAVVLKRYCTTRKLRSLNFGECTVSVIQKAYSP